MPTIAAHIDVLDLPSDASAPILAAADQDTITVNGLAEELAEITTAFDCAGVRVMAVKGLALAMQAHGNLSARGTGDHDLLVAPDDLERAHGVLVSMGWRPLPGSTPPGRTFAWRHLARNHYELQMRKSTSRVDLHWHLAEARSSLPSFDLLWQRRATVSIAGTPVSTLAPYDALAHSASHSAGDSWAWLRGLLDVHRLMSDPATWAGADRPLHREQLLTVGLAARILGVPPGAPPVVHEAIRRTGRVWERVLKEQVRITGSSPENRVPGLALLRNLAVLHRAGADRHDYARLASISLMPPALLAQETSRSGLVAVPRVLARRTSETARLWTTARKERTRVSTHVRST